MDKKTLQKSLELLLSPAQSLRELAVISGQDPLIFYNGASLIGLDLDGQDLTGLNFDNADLRFSLLDNVQYERGAFNNSTLDQRYSTLKDTFLFNFADVTDFPTEKLLMFAQFRAGVVDACLSTIANNYGNFAEKAEISVASLRKARNEKIVAIETAQSIAQTILIHIDKTPSPLIFDAYSLTRQPNVRFCVGGNNGPFRALSRERLAELLAFRQHRIDSKLPSALNYAIGDYRETAENLEYWEKQFVLEGEYIPGRSTV